MEDDLNLFCKWKKNLPQLVLCTFVIGAIFTEIWTSRWFFIPTFPHPPTRTSSEIAGNEQNLLFNIGRSTLVEYTSVLKKWKTTSMEDNLSGRQPQWKITSVEDDISGKGPQWKMTLLAWNQQNICRSTIVESETIFKRWKTAFMEDNINISSASAVKPTWAWAWHSSAPACLHLFFKYCIISVSFNFSNVSLGSPLTLLWPRIYTSGFRAW